MRIFVKGKEVNGEVIKETSEYYIVKFKGGKCLRVGKNKTCMNYKTIKVKK